MKIYAIRDRLINYYQQPFAAHNDHEVMAAISKTVTEGGNVLAQAPHHFEIWSLGEVQETGHITGRPEFLADLSTLIRPGRDSTGSGEGTVAQAQGGVHRPHRRPVDEARAKASAPEGPPQAEAGVRAQIPAPDRRDD